MVLYSVLFDAIRKWYWWLVLLVVLTPSLAFCKWPYDSVGRVTNGEAGGSATLIGVNDSRDSGLVITCAHVFEGGPARAKFSWPSVPGRAWMGRLLKIDYKVDMSLWKIANPPDIKTPAGVDTARKEEGPFTAVGFPYYSRGMAHFSKGDFISMDQNGFEVYTEGLVHSGYSGGALFNSKGEYCGIVCGTTPLDNRGRPTGAWGDWNSRHTTGPPMLRMVAPYMGVEK